MSSRSWRSLLLSCECFLLGLGAVSLLFDVDSVLLVFFPPLFFHSRCVASLLPPLFAFVSLAVQKEENVFFFTVWTAASWLVVASDRGHCDLRGFTLAVGDVCVFLLLLLFFSLSFCRTVRVNPRQIEWFTVSQPRDG